jgi:predicted transcriptional regulator
MVTKIRNVMQRDPVLLSADISARDAARSLRTSQKDCILVEKDGRFYGIATETDLAIHGSSDKSVEDCPRLLNACSRVITTLSPQDSIGDAISMIRQQGRRRIPEVSFQRRCLVYRPIRACICFTSLGPDCPPK